jgi:predicted ATPase
MLSRLYIDNYRCFVNFTLQLKAKQLILGVNGSGKSVFLSVLRDLRDFMIVGSKADQIFTPETRTRWQTLSQQTFELEVAGNGGKYIYTLWVEVPEEKARSRVLKETLDFDEKPLLIFQEDQVHLFDDNHEKKATYPFDSDRSALAMAGRKTTSSKIEWFKQWANRLCCIRLDPSQMGAEAKGDDDYPKDDLSNFAAWYSNIIQEHPGSFVSLQRSLNEIFDGFESLVLKKAGRTRVLRAAFFEPPREGDRRVVIPGIEFDFDELSDGQRVLIALYTLLHSAIAPETTICLDEPENFLALAEIQPWLLELNDRIREQAAQAILISHHPELIDLLAVECGLVFSRSGLGPVRVEPYRPDDVGKLRPSERIARGWERG